MKISELFEVILHYDKLPKRSQDKFLYRGVDLKTLLIYLISNKMIRINEKNSEKYGIEEFYVYSKPGKIADDYTSFHKTAYLSGALSFTWNPDFFKNDSHAIDKNYSIILTLDRSKLQLDYKIQPYHDPVLDLEEFQSEEIIVGKDILDLSSKIIRTSIINSTEFRDAKIYILEFVLSSFFKDRHEQIKIPFLFNFVEKALKSFGNSDLLIVYSLLSSKDSYLSKHEINKKNDIITKWNNYVDLFINQKTPLKTYSNIDQFIAFEKSNLK